MTESVLSLMTRMRAATTDEETRALCEQMYSRIEVEPAVVAAHIRNALSLSVKRIVRAVVGADAAREARVLAHPYRDVDEKMKMALSVVFVQDYRSVVPGADAGVAASVFDSIAARHLTGVLNDISVNCEHIHNGALVVDESSAVRGA